MNRITPSFVGSLDSDGFGLISDVISRARAAELLTDLTAAAQRNGIQRRGGILAVRNLLEVVPVVVGLARSGPLRNIAEAVLGSACFAVRGILFDKTPATNWKVTWHQDLTIAVKRRFDVEGFGPWSDKAGIVSVQPPANILENMVTIRIHLDDCGLENGPVRVLPGSHRDGRLNPAQIAQWRAHTTEFPATASIGGALVMKPLLLHASSPASRPGHRRVVHLDFAGVELPGGLEWHTRV